jgi:hypothetical protein
MTSYNSYGETLRTCGQCKAEILEDEYFTKNRRGEYYKLCDDCRVKNRDKQRMRAERARLNKGVNGPKLPLNGIVV